LLVLLALLLLLAAVATVVDGRAGRKAAGRVEAVGRADTTVEPLLLPAAAESSNAVPTAAAPPTTPPAAPTVAPPTAPLATLPAAADAGATADDGATEKSRRRPPSLLSSFSLRRNLVSLTARRANSTMGCLDGLRCLSMAWVILGHTLVYPATEPVGGLQYISELLPKGFTVPPGSGDVSIPPNGGHLAEMAYQIVPGAFFAVDTFFWMGGLLTALALLKQMRRMRAGWFRLYPAFLVGRWVRLAPLVVVAILWTIGVNDALGDGPFWDLQGDSAECAKSWWADILYVQNVMWLARPEYSKCLPHLWYLSNDMQFYLFAPLFVFPYVAHKAAGWVVLVTSIAASTGANVYLTVAGHYVASPILDQAYFGHIYVQPYTRVQPWLVGVALAYVWDEHCHRDACSRPEPLLDGRLVNGTRRRLFRWTHRSTLKAWLRRFQLWLLALAAAGVCLADVFGTGGTYGLYQHYPSEWSAAQNAAYISLSRLGWALGLSVLAFLCFSNQLPVVNTLLSWSPFETLGKLTYAAYIIHPLILTPMSYSSTELIRFSSSWFASSFTTYLVWATSVALVLWLLVEKPAANLLAAGLGRLGFGSSAASG